MKRTRQLQSLLMGAAGVCGLAGTALAAPQEYSLLLLDRTGSMGTVTNAATGSTRWTDAMDAAISVIQLKDSDHFTDRAYAIWDFRLGAGTVGGPTNDPNQDNAKQVWPLVAKDCTDLCLPAAANCATFVTSAAGSGATNNYCDFGSAGADAPYESLVALLGKYKTDPDRTPDANGNGRTPMSDALCRVLDQVRAATSNLAQTITLESDGLENQSSATGACGNFSIASTAVPFSTDASSVWQKTVTDWGMSAAAKSGAPDAVDSTVFPGGGSWEARVVRRSLRLTTPSTTTATGSVIVANETASTNLAWRVHAHYTTFTGSSVSALASVSPAAAFGMAAASTSDVTSVTPKFAVSALAAGISAPTTTAAAAAPTVTLSIPQAELAMFRQLGSPSYPSKGNGAQRSFFQGITQVPGQTYGTNHRLPGDVDDSGCTDRADYAIILQKDVWRQRAVLPNQLAIRADLSKDGWVNDADRAIVISHWGQGCINPVGPPPKL